MIGASIFGRWDRLEQQACQLEPPNFRPRMLVEGAALEAVQVDAAEPFDLIPDGRERSPHGELA